MKLRREAVKEQHWYKNFWKQKKQKEKNTSTYLLIDVAGKIRTSKNISCAAGHSQNENDPAHPVIESHYWNRFLYTPSQRESTLQQPFKTNFCQVTVLNFNDIIDFKSSLYIFQYSTVLAGKCFLEVVGESKTKLKTIIRSEIVQLKVTEA